MAIGTMLDGWALTALAVKSDEFLSAGFSDEGGSAVRDQGDFLQDDDGSLSELELLSKLIIAAAEFDGPMSVESIDRILRV